MKPKTFATNTQKEEFKNKFAEIVKDNDRLGDQYSIQFFDTAVKTNYVIRSKDGKSINVMENLSIQELEQYRALKNHWQ
jgi:hypothetical protein